MTKYLDQNISQILTKEYISNKNSIRDIAKKYNISYGKLIRLFRDCEIITRTRSESLTGRRLSQEHLNKLKNRKFSDEHIQNISKAMIKRSLDPNYINKMHKYQSSTKYLCGSFSSDKNECAIWFGSSYELSAYLKLEEDNTVKQYGRCMFSLPYLYKGKARRYFPDIMVEYFSGEKEIIEVKPERFLNDPVVIVKRLTLENYCRENSMSCRFWTESDIIKGKNHETIIRKIA